MIKYLLSLCLIFFLSVAGSGQSGCPGCMSNLPEGLPEDTIYLGPAEDGQVGLFYESDLSFRMPKTTDPVHASDPDTPPGLTLNEITVTGLSNLPPGLSWEASQTVFDPAEETDGCVRLCGVPLIPGFYEVEVVITARIFVLNETTSFSFPLLILPGTSVTEGFTLENNTGCGSVAASFTNNVPSEGREGYSYFWDFGNGNMSLLENPQPQTYTEPGTYELAYQALIDTFGYLLTDVVVEEVGCSDAFNNAPDLRVEVIGPDGERILSTPEVENAETPLTFTLNLFIGEGNYTLRVMDEDSGLGGGDDECGTINFTRESGGQFSSGSLTASLNIFHPVDTIRSVDTVIVYEQPRPPLLAPALPVDLCQGDALLLQQLEPYTQEMQLQWYQDSLPLLEETGPALEVSEDGSYWVVANTPEGCSAVSSQLEVSFSPLPESPVFQNFDNLLVLFDPGALPDNYSLQWFLDGVAIPDANEQEYCLSESGTYRLDVRNELTGCSNSYSLQQAYDPAYAGCVASSVEEEQALALQVFPNPFRDELFLRGAAAAGPATVLIRNAQGQLAARRDWPHGGGAFQHEIRLGHFPAGLYLVEVQVGNVYQNLKVLKH